MTRGVENIWISFENIFNYESLCNSMIFTREDKMTSSNRWNMSWEFKRIKFKVLLEIIFNLELFGFYSNYFSPKIKYLKNRVTWFPTTENWRKINLKSFWYFLKWFLLDFNRPVALFDLSEFVWILFEVIKMFTS